MKGERKSGYGRFFLAYLKKKQYFCKQNRKMKIMSRYSLVILLFSFVLTQTLTAGNISLIEKEKVNGPVAEIIETNFDYSKPKKTDIIEKEIDKCLNKKKSYKKNIYSRNGHLVETITYKNGAMEQHSLWKQSEQSKDIYHHIFLDKKNEPKNDYREIIAYNQNGDPLQIVHMNGAIITAQDRYEYDSQGHLLYVYWSLKENKEFLREAYSYDSLGRLSEYRYYYKPDTLSFGYTFQYSDSVVRKNGYWGINAEEKGTPDCAIYYLNEAGHITKVYSANGNGNYTEEVYLHFDRYGNWTDKIVTYYRHNSMYIQTGEIEPQGIRIENAFVCYPGDSKTVTRYVRKIKYFAEDK